jgi:hypothetical protein
VTNSSKATIQLTSCQRFWGFLIANWNQAINIQYLENRQ